MKEERILISEDENLLPLMQKDLKEYLPLLEKVKTSYENLDLSSFSDEVLKEIATLGTKAAEKRFESKLRDQLKKAGITSKVIQENMMNGSWEIFQEFKMAVEKLKAFNPTRYSLENKPGLPLGYISYLGSSFFISEEDMEELLEKHARTYLDSEEEKSLYDSLNHFIEAYQTVKIHLDKAKFPVRAGIRSIENDFLIIKDGKYSVRPSMIKGALEHFKKQQAFHRDRMEWQEKMAKRRN